MKFWTWEFQFQPQTRRCCCTCRWKSASVLSATSRAFVQQNPIYVCMQTSKATCALWSHYYFTSIFCSRHYYYHICLFLQCSCYLAMCSIEIFPYARLLLITYRPMFCYGSNLLPCKLKQQQLLFSQDTKVGVKILHCVIWGLEMWPDTTSPCDVPISTWTLAKLRWWQRRYMSV